MPVGSRGPVGPCTVHPSGALGNEEDPPARGCRQCPKQGGSELLPRWHPRVATAAHACAHAVPAGCWGRLPARARCRARCGGRAPATPWGRRASCGTACRRAGWRMSRARPSHGYVLPVLLGWEAPVTTWVCAPCPCAPYPAQARHCTVASQYDLFLEFNQIFIFHKF